MEVVQGVVVYYFVFVIWGLVGMMCGVSLDWRFLNIGGLGWWWWLYIIMFENG